MIIIIAIVISVTFAFFRKFICKYNQTQCQGVVGGGGLPRPPPPL